MSPRLYIDMELTGLQLAKIHDFANDLARCADLLSLWSAKAQRANRQAGQQIKEASEKRWREAPTTDSSKKNSVDVRWFDCPAKKTRVTADEQLVTETDQAVEQFVIKAIEKAYPTHKFIGEESYAAGKQPDLTDEPTWCALACLYRSRSDVAQDCRPNWYLGLVEIFSVTG